MSVYRRLIEKTLRSKESTFCVGDRSRLSWRKEILREFGEWVPIANAGGPTMGTSTTFGYYVGGSPLINGETGQPITYTASGLGGVESLPTTVTIDQGFGDIANVDAPTYNQLSLAGYAPVLPFFRREDYKDVNAMLDASQEYAKRVLADIYMGARVDQQQQIERQEAERTEMMNKVSSYVSQLGIDINTLQKNGAAIDKNGRLVVLSHDGGSMGLEYSNNRSITIYNPAYDDYGNLHKIEYGGVGAYSSDIGQIGTTTISVGDSVNFWSNVGNVAHFTDFGISHNPNEIGEVLVGNKKVGPKIVGQKEVGPIKPSNSVEILSKQGETFVRYLTNKLPKKINNKYLGQNYIDSIIKNMDPLKNGLTGKGTGVSIGDNIIGSASKTFYNPKTDKYHIQFNYDFDKNIDAIQKDPEKYNYKPGLNRFAMNTQALLGGDYGLDASTVPGAGYAIMGAKSLGGGKSVEGEITISRNRLQKLNRTFADEMNRLHNVQESTTWSKIKKYISENK